MNNKVIDYTPYFFNENINAKKRVFNKKIGDIMYYFKSGSFLYIELLVSEIYSLLNVPCVKQEFVKIHDSYFLMSKSFKNENYKYYNGFEFMDDYLSTFTEEELKTQGLGPLEDENGDLYFYPYNSLETIWSALIYKNVPEDEIREIMINLIEYYSLSIILLDYDFHPGNWSIEMNNNHARLVPKYDNEACFSSSFSKPMFLVDPTDKDTTYLESLEYFLSITSEDDRFIFKQLFEKCDEDLINTAIANITLRYGEDLKLYLDKQKNYYSKESILRKFSSNRDNIIDLLRNMEFTGR